MAIKLLVVEDEQDLVTLLKFIFEKFGFEVVEAQNGQEALDLLGLGKPNPAPLVPDVIVSDIMMPVMDGYTMVTQLQENDDMRKIPVIIMTAKGQTKDLFQSSNIAGFIEKPFEPRVLKELVSKVLKK